MKGAYRRIALILGSVAVVVGFLTAPAQPQFTSSGAAITTQIVNSTAPTGQSSVLALNGLYSNCSVIAVESAGGAANITVYGNGQTGQTGPGGSPIVNANFGTAGVIAVTPTLAVTSANVANLPVGLYFTWASNTGTLTAYATCTSAIARGGAAGPTPSPFPGVTVTTAPCGSVPSSTGTVVTVPYCGLPTYATTGFQTPGTGTTANGYVQIGPTLTLTPGNSGTANGWIVTVTVWATAISAGLATVNLNTCATSPSTFTVLDGSHYTNSNSLICAGTSGSTGVPFAGSSQFGEQSAAGLAQYGLSNTAIGHVTIANNATFSVLCWVSSSTTVNQIVGAWCFAQAEPSV